MRRPGAATGQFPSAFGVCDYGFYGDDTKAPPGSPGLTQLIPVNWEGEKSTTLVAVAVPDQELASTAKSLKSLQMGNLRLQVMLP
jgi:hypothetical protein